MSANNRLQDMQLALKKRGLRDVKFFFAPAMLSKPSSVVASNVADFVDAYLKGRSKLVERIGDAPVAK